MYSVNEVRIASEMYVPDVALSDAEVHLAEQVIENLSMDPCEAKKFRNTYRETRVMALIDQKRQGKPLQSRHASNPAKVNDLMQAFTLKHCDSRQTLSATVSRIAKLHSLDPQD